MISSNNILGFTWSICIFMSCMFCKDSFGQEMKQENKVTFEEAINDFSREEKNLRKWDAPVVADLDQDGRMDLLLNDHGFSLRVCWNNDGNFAAPYDIIMGDMHGVTVADFDGDGLIEMVVSRGGGSGSNARNSKLYRVTKDREFIALPDFEIPFELMRGRTVKFFDGDNDGDLDLLNFAFPDKEKQGESENYIYESNSAKQLILSSSLPPSKVDGQKTLITDFNGDNDLDLILYGNGNVKAFKGKKGLNFEDVSESVFPSGIGEVTSIVELDYDNDGDFDLYLTRGLDFNIGETFYDKESKVWGFYTKRGRVNFEDLEVGEVLEIENYQAQWPDNDALYIGETAYPYEFTGETHSGKDIRLVNSDALGFPDKIGDQSGAYIGYVGNRKWRFSGDIWAPATGVFHGVESYPAYDHQEGLRDILLENKDGNFIDITDKINLSFEEHTVGAASADFDNNGYQDLVVIKRGDLIHENKADVFLNDGKGIFKRSNEHSIKTADLGSMGMAVETMDYNSDGKVDVVLGNERGKWHLFKNTSFSSFNFVVIQVLNSPKNGTSPLGAIVTLDSCSNKQSRRVGSTGAAYSLSYNNLVHFGIGECDAEIKIRVEWSNGEIEESTSSGHNETLTIGQ